MVQEVLAEANGKLDRYMHERPIMFYPWLRALAWERVGGVIATPFAGKDFYAVPSSLPTRTANP